jgi:drug/metabolite transporter (DMT)-like permease
VSSSPENASPDGSLIIGIVMICLGAICMVGLDASARMLLETYSLPQLVLLRCVFSISLIGAFALARSELATLRTKRPGWHIARSFLMAGSMFAFFHALRHIPLADVIVIENSQRSMTSCGK